jgi:multimeric flavodoxin WrbA
MLEWVLDEIRREGVETDLIQVGGQNIVGCKACGACGKMAALKCVQEDILNPILPRIAKAEALLLGSPVFFADLTPELKCFIDRVGFVTMHHGNPLRRKIGAAVVVARRAGHVHTYDSINHFFGITQMITVGSRYWNLGVAHAEGSVREDREAEDTMRILGSNMAWLIHKIRGDDK